MDNNSPVTGTLKVCHLLPQVVDQAADNLFALKLHKDYAMLLNNNGISSSSLESYIFIGALHVGTVSPTATQKKFSKGINFYISVEILWKIWTKLLISSNSGRITELTFYEKHNVTY